jgi:transposase
VQAGGKAWQVRPSAELFATKQVLADMGCTVCDRSWAQLHVVAPSLTPMKSGDRVKTDRRDAGKAAQCRRLTAIWIPDAAHEAMRDLVRARATAARVLTQARQHLQGFLPRDDRIYSGPRAWTLAYRRWLTTVRFDHPAQQIVLQDYIHAVEDADARRDRLSTAN